MRSRSEIVTELLVFRCQNGEREAFELLIKQWHTSVFRRAVRLTGSDVAAQDIVQDVWIAATKGIKRLEDPSKFRSWIYRIVGNKCADWIRKRQSERQLSVTYAETVMSNHASGDMVGDIGHLRTELRKIPDDQRIILTLFYLEEMAIREMALILCIPEGTVKSRLYNARKVLREALEG